MAVNLNDDDADDDASLLKRFVQARDERAFRRLVERHVDLIYAAARRQTRGDAHLADDITQAVFVVFARKAASVRNAAALPGWLIATTRFVAPGGLRGRARRPPRRQGTAHA